MVYTQSAIAEMRLCRVALKRRCSVGKKKAQLTSRSKKKQQQQKNKKKKKKREKNGIIVVHVWYGKKKWGCISFEFHSCINSSSSRSSNQCLHLCSVALLCTFLKRFPPLGMIASEYVQWKHQQWKFARLVDEMRCILKRHDTRLKIHCVSKCCTSIHTHTHTPVRPWRAWHRMAHKITLIEHEHRLIQFDSISRARVFNDRDCFVWNTY